MRHLIIKTTKLNTIKPSIMSKLNRAFVPLLEIAGTQRTTLLNMTLLSPGKVRTLLHGRKIAMLSTTELAVTHHAPTTKTSKP